MPCAPVPDPLCPVPLSRTPYALCPCPGPLMPCAPVPDPMPCAPVTDPLCPCYCPHTPTPPEPLPLTLAMRRLKATASVFFSSSSPTTITFPDLPTAREGRGGAPSQYTFSSH